MNPWWQRPTAEGASEDSPGAASGKEKAEGDGSGKPGTGSGSATAKKTAGRATGGRSAGGGKKAGGKKAASGRSDSEAGRRGKAAGGRSGGEGGNGSGRKAGGRTPAGDSGDAKAADKPKTRSRGRRGSPATSDDSSATKSARSDSSTAKSDADSKTAAGAKRRRRSRPAAGQEPGGSGTASARRSGDEAGGAPSEPRGRSASPSRGGQARDRRRSAPAVEDLGPEEEPNSADDADLRRDLESLPERTQSVADERKIAMFCDLENIAIGVRDSKIKKFDINLILERLLEKGKIIVKKAYCDWERYSDYKRPFHEAAVELIDIPQKYYSGKNSADIKMVVDAMDLCYSKEHLDTFAILSGDSDFSPLVSKLKENDKRVIGVGVKDATSALLVDNCDEFIYYEDIWRDHQQAPQVEAPDKKKSEAFRLMIDAMQALSRENKDVLWGSMIKQTMQRKKPSFNEGYYGYSAFSDLLEDAERNNLIKLKKDQRSGTYIVTGFSGRGGR